MKILAIDPGTTESGWCLYEPGRVLASGVSANANVLKSIETDEFGVELIAIEMIASYGMAVGQEVFDTCVWVGRFVQAWRQPEEVQLVKRMKVKQYLCHNTRATDSNIRQALIDLLGAPGTKKSPGATYGVTSHAWAALAVAVTTCPVGIQEGMKVAA